MRHGAHHRHVVGDEQVAQAPVALQALQQGQHLFLDGDVERAGGLVQHQQVGLHDQGARQGDALALPAREFVRVARQQLRKARFVQPDFGQLIAHAGGARGGVQLGRVHAQALAHDLFHRHARRQRRERILKHHLHGAPQGLIVRVPMRPAAPVDQQAAADLPRRQQAQRRLRQRGLARAGFADHPQRAPRRQRKAGIFQRHKAAFAKPALHTRQRRGVGHAQRLPGHDRRGIGLHRRLDHIAHGLAGHQLLGVRLARVGKDFFGGALLYQAAVFHHRHAVGKAAHQVQVVRDHQHRHAVLAAQVFQQRQDLPAQADVQRGGGLVGQQQLGLARQRHGDHRPLALPARQLVRVAAGAAGGLGDAGIR